MSIKSYVLLFLPLLLVLALSACDSDSSGNAQDMSDPDACPCFSAEDITDDAMGKDFFGCQLFQTRSLWLLIYPKDIQSL